MTARPLVTRQTRPGVRFAPCVRSPRGSPQRGRKGRRMDEDRERDFDDFDPDDVNAFDYEPENSDDSDRKDEQVKR